MPDEAAFVQQILARPDDDAPRLAFADWLDARGDARGEFIRVQCELAKELDYTRRHWELTRRKAELLAVHQQAWLEPLSKLGLEPVTHTFKRGLVDLAVLDPDTFVRHGAEMLDLAPTLQTLELHDLGDRLPALLEVEHWSRLRGLIVASYRIDHGDIKHLLELPALANIQRLVVGHAPLLDDGAAILARSAHFSSLRSLDLMSAELTSEGVRLLAQSPHLAGLQQLILDSNALQDEGINALAQSPYLTNLQELNLTQTQCAEAGISALCRSGKLAKLQTLRLINNSIGSLGGLYLGSAPPMPDLQELGLATCGLQNAGAAAIAASQSFSNLKRLYLHNNQISDDGAIWLGRSAFRTQLEYLGLSSNRFTRRGLKGLIAGGGWPALKVLNLNSCELDDAALEGFSLAGFPLTVLYLSNNRISSASLATLIKSIDVGALLKLNLDRNQLDDDAVQVLTNHSLYGALRVLDLSSNQLTAKAAYLLAAAGGRLEELWIQENPLGDQGAAALMHSPQMASVRNFSLSGTGITNVTATAIATSSSLGQLEWLDLGKNAISDEGAKALAESTNLPRLTWLGLSANSIGDAGAMALAQSPHLHRLDMLVLTGNPSIGAAALAALEARFGARVRLDSPEEAAEEEVWMHNKVFRITADDLEDYAERLARHPELLAGYQRWLTRVPELDQLVEQIEQAFAGETLGSGTGLLEAQGMDDYADDADLAELRERDEHSDWRRIDVELLNQCYSSPSFFDARGFAFHLPAFLIAELNDEYSYGFIHTLIVDLEEGTPSWLDLLSSAQREAIAATLRIVSEHPEYDDMYQAIPTAIERLTGGSG